MTAERYPEQIDCVWLGVDRDGNVAAFVTGGSGPIPANLLDDKNFEVSDIERRIVQLSRTSGARLLVHYKRADDFIAFAERGIFAYDWSDVHRRQQRDVVGAYELIAAPVQPINVAQLPDDLATLTMRNELSNESFTSANTIDVRRALHCIEAR